MKLVFILIGFLVFCEPDSRTEILTQRKIAFQELMDSIRDENCVNSEIPRLTFIPSFSSSSNGSVKTVSFSQGSNNSIEIIFDESEANRLRNFLRNPSPTKRDLITFQIQPNEFNSVLFAGSRNIGLKIIQVNTLIGVLGGCIVGEEIVSNFSRVLITKI